MIKSHNVLIIVCFGIIYLVWGSTYLFAAFGLEEIPAFQMCFYRYFIAGFLTLGLGFMIGKRWAYDSLTLRNAILGGVLMMGMGTTGGIWALKYLDSGLTALIIAGEPLIILLMLWAWDGQLPDKKAFLGVFLGILGMSLLVNQDILISTREEWYGLMAILASMLSWGIGSIFMSRVQVPDNTFINSGIQMITGGLVSLTFSMLAKEEQVSIVATSGLTLFSLSYLIILGSIVAYTAYNYLLRKVSTEKVVTNTYVNPVVALVLGYLFRDELITSKTVIAAIIMISGVYFVNTSRGTKKPSH